MTENNKTSSSSGNGSNQLPPEWKLRLIMAWDSGLKVLITPLLFIIPAVLVFKFVSEEWLVLSIVGVLSLALGWMLFSELFSRRESSLASTVLLVCFILCLLGVAMYPVAKPHIQEEYLGHFVFNAEGESQVIPAQKDSHEWWLMEVHGKLPDVDNAYSVAYTFRVENELYKDKIKGDLDKKWQKTRVGRRTRGKRLASHERNVHHLTADLKQDTTLTLKKLDGKLDGPLEIFLRQEPVMWEYLLTIDLPLLLLAGLFEAIESEKKNKLHLAWGTSFLTLFTTGFVDNYVPGSLASPIIIGMIMAIFGSMILGYLVPRLMRPVARKIAG